MWPRRRKVIVGIFAALLLLLIGGKMAAEFVTELYWYRGLGYESVFWRRWAVALLTRGVLALLLGSFVFVNLWVVARALGTIRVRRRYGNIEIAEQLPHGYVLGALTLVSLFSAWWLSVGFGDSLAVLAALRPASWGVTDPFFGRDLSFYALRFPILSRLQALAGILVFWTGLLVGAAYVATGAIRWTENRPRATLQSVRHLAVLIALLLLVGAWDAWLDRYQLLIAGSGVGGAFGYTDHHARLPAKALHAAVSLLAAGGLVWSVWTRRHRPALAALSLVLVTWLGGLVIYPAALQKLTVEPNEFERERPYIENNLEFTRRAYGLADLRRERLAYQAPDSLSAERLLSALEGVPLWDERPLLQAFRQRQNIQPRYNFVSVSADRYGSLEAPEQVAIAVRELDLDSLPERSRTWQNLHLIYVSGKGAVVSPASRMTRDGTPVFHLSDLDPPKLGPTAPPELALRRSEIYFGENSEDYVIVPRDTGPGGVAMDAPWKRWLLAWAFQSRNLLLSSALDERSVLVYRRQVRERVRALAPFLQIPRESATYPVIQDGRVVWVVEGLTSTLYYPLAPARVLDSRAVRYVRNSVKATVDAVSGEVRFYIADPRDPLIRTWAAWFPELFQPIAEMPAGLRRHLRFAPSMLAVQADVLGQYHVPDARVFYAQEDVWTVATEDYRDVSLPVEPTFATLRLPGGERKEFLLTIPFVSVGRQNMTALLVARNDPPHYGEQVLFQLPRDELVLGPQQVESMIDQDPDISQQLSLWRQGGSDVIRGHIIVVPIDSTLVYLEPLFLEAENAAIPQLERVILATPRRVVMRPTLAEAVEALALGRPALATEPGPAPTSARAEPAGGSVSARARSLMRRADERLRAGDWAGFGERWRELRELLDSVAADTAGGG